jgi:(1->4)-alpha-D-glucan 1-alpha-D-glucosylmutase
VAAHLPAAGRPVPASTYRLQLHPGFRLPDAAGVCDYLAALGVSHVYCSPVLASTPGSVHGYDVVDHGRIDDELGGTDGWRTLVAATASADLGTVLDIVPNHMAVPEPLSLNRQLWDVLKHGRGSAYAEWFDIDWAAQGGRLLLPVLGEPIGECLRRQEIRRDGDVLRYYDNVFPLAPGTEQTDDLVTLLAEQHYRLAWWRVGREELNYRRFFDVTALIGVRVERPDVFAATHATLLSLDGVDGWRVDHPDGLADPAGYLRRLAEATGDLWIVAEKILEPGEQLPGDWRCAGTTGYDALNQVMGVLTDPAGERPLTDLSSSLTGAADYATVVAAAKRHVVEHLLVAEVDLLTDTLVRLAARSVDTWDFSRRWLREALVEVLTAFEVYRAYVPVDDPAPAEPRHQVAAACERARERRPDRTAEIGWIGRLALLDGPSDDDAVDFAVRFAQTTGPVMAKGIEDTAFYRYVRLTALNEVGGDPGRFGIAPADFHAWAADLARDWPATMTTLSTHDTKRSEDVRARLLTLAEIPGEWSAAVTRWRARHHLGDPDLEYLFWQSLVGAWPISAERMAGYVEKASREAKRRTSWTDPDPAYDEMLQSFVREVYADDATVADVELWVREHVLVPGRITSLAQKLLQLTMPGVPDCYQGGELWDLSLVDPDNRRPVDYDRRRTMLRALDEGHLPPAVDDDEEGWSKLLVTSRVLRSRRARPELFGPSAGYRALTAAGPAADHLLGFVRGEGAASLATRLPVGLRRTGGWRDTTVPLPAGVWTDVLTGRSFRGGDIPVAKVLDGLPVGLLVTDG